jgi:hypothetical protein
MASRRG